MNKYRIPSRVRGRNRRFEISRLIGPALFAGVIVFSLTAHSEPALSVDSETVEETLVFPAERPNPFDKTKFPVSDSYEDRQSKALAETVVARQVGGGS